VRAFFFPGQGSQSVGMGVSLAGEYEAAASVFDRASGLAGYDMRELCAEGPAEKLSRTQYTQPALFTVEAAIVDTLAAFGFGPDVAAGHSLGEFGAWYAAGAFGFEDGFRLVSERGRLMDGADPGGIGTMAAVIGLDASVVEEACGSVNGTVVVANYNSPLQQVISGEKDAVLKVGEIVKERGAKRVLPLNVSGAFHSPLMAAAKKEFAVAVESTDISDTRIPVYANVTAAPVTAAEDIRRLMVEQLTSPVRWTETVRALVAGGVGEAYEIGPGNVIAGLVKRIDNGLAVQSMAEASSVREVA